MNEEPARTFDDWMRRHGTPVTPSDGLALARVAWEAGYQVGNEDGYEEAAQERE